MVYIRLVVIVNTPLILFHRRFALLFLLSGRAILRRRLWPYFFGYFSGCSGLHQFFDDAAGFGELGFVVLLLETF